MMENVKTNDTGIAMVLCKLHEWEVNRLQILRSATGRQLYFSVVKNTLFNDNGPMVKEIMNAHHITDRALRIRLRSLIEEEYLQLELSETDKRIRLVKPNDAFQKDFEEHLSTVKKLLQDHYYLLEK